MYMQLEDEFGDVVGKARRGREISVSALAEQVGISQKDVERIESYELTPPDDTIDALADCLELDCAKLRSAAGKRFFPLYPSGRPVEGLVLQMLVLGSDFLMNGYVVGCRETHKGVVMNAARAAELGIATRVEQFDASVLRQAEEIFITSTAGGVMPATTLDGEPVGAGKPGPVTLQMRQRYWDAHEEERWTTPVNY